MGQILGAGDRWIINRTYFSSFRPAICVYAYFRTCKHSAASECQTDIAGDVLETSWGGVTRCVIEQTRPRSGKEKIRGIGDGPSL